MARRLGVIVAGGPGERLSLGIPKALVRVGGMTLLERAMRTLGRVCERVVVVAPAGLALPVDPAARVDDVAAAAGPLAGVVAGLGHEPFEQAVVMAVDYPLLGAEFLAALLDRLGDHAAVIPVPHGVPQPLAAAYAPRASASLRAALEAGERSITVAAWRLGPHLVHDDELEQLAGGFENFLNVNTPADLARAEAMLGLRDRSGDAA
jgi:molybdenum cofactor guanylyltransferase